MLLVPKKKNQRIHAAGAKAPLASDYFFPLRTTRFDLVEPSLIWPPIYI